MAPFACTCENSYLLFKYARIMQIQAFKM